MRGKHRRFDPIGFGLNAWLVLVGLFVLAPMFFVVLNSFNSTPISIFPPEGFSLHWYKITLFNISPYSPAPQFGKGLRNSIVIASGATSLALLMGALASLALVRHRFSGKEAVRSFFSSPLIVPRLVFGIALFLLYIRIGIYGTIPGVMIAHALLGLPYVVSIITANLFSIDLATEEAAMDLGANRVQAFLLVTLPQMRVGLIVATLFAFITSFDQVDVTIFLTGPRNNTLPVEMLHYVEEHQNPVLAAVSTMLIAFSALLVVIGVFLLRAQEYRRFLERK